MGHANRLFLAFVTLVALAWGQAADTRPAPQPESRRTIPLGKAAQAIDFDGTPLEIHTLKPPGYAGERMLIVMHGVLRNADEYRDDSAGMAERFGALVIAPKFDATRFPSWRYQQGGIRGPDSRPRTSDEWTYAFIPKIAREIRRIEGRPQMPYWIIGHSAGGQFVARMSAFQDTGAERLVAANPGSDLFPTRDMTFGYGFGGLPESLSSDDRLKSYLAAPLTLFLGTADDHPDENFDGSAPAMKQGAGRYQRGLECFRRGRELAAERRWAFNWRLVEAPGIAHDHSKMFDHPQCEVALFGRATESRPSTAGRD